MNNVSILLDVMVILVVLIMFFAAKKRGFVRSVINLLGAAIAALGSYILSGHVAQFIFNTLVRGNVLSAVDKAVAQGGESMGQIASSIASSLPFLTGADVSASVSETINQFSAGGNQVLAEKLTDGVIGPAILPLITGLSFVILFLLLLVIVKVLSKFIGNGLRHVPIIGSVDAWLGGAVGIAEGLLLLLVIAMVIGALPALTGSPIASQEQIDATYLFRHFYYFIQF